MTLVALSLLLLLGAGWGCGKTDRRLPVHPAKGQVLIDDKPAGAGVRLQLWPREEIKPPLDTYAPQAETDDQGSFTLSTYETGDGAPAGTYTVTLTWPERYNPISTHWEGDKLGGKYKDPKTSKIEVTINKGPNELAPIKVTR